MDFEDETTGDSLLFSAEGRMRFKVGAGGKK
jgi:hypothetical protein